MSANRFIESLTNLCREHLLAPKWLIAPSLRVGHQWLQSVTRTGQPVINARVQTLKGIALDLASGEMAQQQLTLITPTAGAFLIDSVWNRMPERAVGYLTKLDRSPTISQTVFSSINALRLAGVQATDIAPKSFEVAAKGTDLALLLSEYLRQLKDRKLVDYSDVLRIATARLQGNLFAFPEDVLVLLPQDLVMHGLERQLLRAIHGDRVRSIALDSLEATNGIESDLGLLSWVLNPSAAPDPRGDGTATIFQAIGEANEVREVLRRCVSAGQPLDQVEVLHTDTATYVPLFYEFAKRFQSDEATLEEGIPVTFAEGIPASYSRPGRALASWLNWVKDNYPQLALVRMLHDGLLQVPGMNDGEFSFSGLAGMLRSIGIGFGRERYLAKIDEQMEALSKQIRRAAASDEDDSAAPRTAAYERRLRGLQLLRTLIATMLELSQPAAASSLGILDRARLFLTQVTRRVNEQDNFAQEVLLNNIDDMKRWAELVGDEMSLDLATWLGTLPAQLHILGSGPKPGCLHVAHALTGGQSGRPHTYVLGLDDSRFPGPALQDPILLDTERKKLSDDLPTAAGRLNDTLRRFAHMLAGLRGNVTLSFSCRDVADDREMFSSSLLLSAFRIVSGQKRGDQTALLQWLTPPASFAPDAPEKCLDEGEWWLWRLCGPEPVSNAQDAVLQRFPHLAAGQHAAGQRASHEFTPFDGFVPDAGQDLDPMQPHGPPVSASALETMGRCPLAFFFRHALKIRPLEELEVDLDRWLDPLAFGSLLHEVFRRFMTQLRSENKLPNFRRDADILEEMLKQEIAKYRDMFPPANESAYRNQCRQLDRAAKIFLVDEQELCKKNVPMFMEASVGLPANPDATPIDEPEPASLTLVDGGSIRVRGRIDRIDRIGGEDSNDFVIWDYKTGSSVRYSGPNPINQGRVIQHVLYLQLVQTLLRRRVDPQAVVQSFGYFFPGQRGMGQRLEWAPQQLPKGSATLQRLCDTMAHGAFIATDNKDDCKFCDYADVCGDVETVTQQSKGKLGNEVVELRSFHELRRNG
jgi:hypothetical protein